MADWSRGIPQTKNGDLRMVEGWKYLGFVKRVEPTPPYPPGPISPLPPPDDPEGESPFASQEMIEVERDPTALGPDATPALDQPS